MVPTVPLDTVAHGIGDIKHITYKGSHVAGCTRNIAMRKEELELDRDEQASAFLDVIRSDRHERHQG